MDKAEINKLDMQSKDIVSDNINKIYELFPNCISEGKIDFDMLRQELSKDIIEDGKEKYQLTWVGKKEAIVNANTPCGKTLRPVKEKSIDFDNTKNIYIEGDNLEALKILQESYLNKVKCIYIDPPYNTGNDFIYNDKFVNENELEQSGQIDKYNNRLISNTETNGRYHSEWLSMMYTRLKISRNLLKDDGVIFISIDENEFVNLKKICDEIFGEKNFVENFIWIKNSTKNNSLTTSTNHEYIMCYSKNIEEIKENKKLFRIKKKGKEEVESIREKFIIEELDKFENPSKELQKRINEFYKEHPEFKGISSYKFVDEDLNVYTSSDLSAPGGNGAKFDIIHPKTKKACVMSSRGWAYKEETIKKLLEDNAILFGENENNVPRLKRFLKNMDTDVVTSIIENNDDGEKDVRLLFEKDKSPFENPKPISLIKELISYVCEKNDIVLDFFSGSSTTLNAIFEYNKIQNTTIQGILVQIPEKCSGNSEAYKCGFETLCDLGEERIRRAAKKIKEETNANIDYGFRVYKVDSSNMKDVYYAPTDLKQSQLNMFESSIKDDRTAEDLLTQVILDLGLTLDLSIEEKKILNNNVYFVETNSLVVCFDDVINVNIIDEICKCNPLKIVFKESSFKTDNDKINTFERIKKMSPEIEVNVI